MLQYLLDKTTSWMAGGGYLCLCSGWEGMANWSRDLSIDKAVQSAALQVC